MIKKLYQIIARTLILGLALGLFISQSWIGAPRIGGVVVIAVLSLAFGILTLFADLLVDVYNKIKANKL